MILAARSSGPAIAVIPEAAVSRGTQCAAHYNTFADRAIRGPPLAEISNGRYADR